MKRRNFLKILGIGAATPVIVVKALANRPEIVPAKKVTPIFAGELGKLDGVPIYESQAVPGYFMYSVAGGPPREIRFSKIDLDPFVSHPSILDARC